MNKISLETEHAFSQELDTTLRVEAVLKAAEAHVGKRFPKKKLRNRLLNLGIDEFVQLERLAFTKYGFPFKFYSQLDEVILVLAHFLDRFKREGGTLQVFAVHKLSQGDEKDFSFWQDAKAKLYLELQNMILLLDKTQFSSGGSKPNRRRSRVRRIFVFRERSDLAFLSQAGINVVGEQLATKIDVGFIFLNKFDHTATIKPFSSTLIVNFNPRKHSGRTRHNFYVFHGVADKSVRHDLPFDDRCSAKWFTRKQRDKALLKDKPLSKLIELFTDDLDKFKDKPKEWKGIEPAHSSSVCQPQQTQEFFNDATLMMFKAYEDSDISKDIGNNKFIIDRINSTIITRDMIRLQRAMTSFTDAIDIRAVDATSIKNSLLIHEASPVYRDWLRRSLNRVLRSDRKTLNRIYILRDDLNDKTRDNEYEALLRLMQYYLDYFHYEVWEMRNIVGRHGGRQSPVAIKNKKWWKGFPGRIGIYLTSSRVIEQYSDEVLKSKHYPTAFSEIFRHPPNDADKDGRKVWKRRDLRRLDYLYARYEIQESNGDQPSKREQHMIYNFLNPRADAGELSFPAFLYRNDLSISDETSRYFPDYELGALQEQYRTNLLGRSLLQYQDTYNQKENRLLKDEVNTYQSDLKLIRKQLKGKAGDVTVPVETLFQIRAAFEKRLYDLFSRHFNYLYDVLKFMSVKIDFEAGQAATEVSAISPFVDCAHQNVGALTEVIMNSVGNKVDDGLERPAEPTHGIDSQAIRLLRRKDGKPWNIFLSYADKDKARVKPIFEKLKREGFAPWMASELFPGENWEEAILAKLDESDFNVLFLSKKLC